MLLRQHSARAHGASGGFAPTLVRRSKSHDPGLDHEAAERAASDLHTHRLVTPKLTPCVVLETFLLLLRLPLPLPLLSIHLCFPCERERVGTICCCCVIRSKLVVMRNSPCHHRHTRRRYHPPSD